MTHRTLCLLMIDTLKKLGDSPTARIDARWWADYYRKDMELIDQRLKKRRKPCVPPKSSS